MCCWRRVAVARVFAIVVRCRIMMLFVNSRVGKNRDTRRESPAGAGAGRTADHLAVLFSQKVLAVRSANDIYRPVRFRALLILAHFTLCRLSSKPKSWGGRREGSFAAFGLALDSVSCKCAFTYRVGFYISFINFKKSDKTI